MDRFDLLTDEQKRYILYLIEVFIKENGPTSGPNSCERKE